MLNIAVAFVAAIFETKGDITMKYESPILEVIKFEKLNVIRTSLNTEGGGSGGEYEGDWSN